MLQESSSQGKASEERTIPLEGATRCSFTHDAPSAGSQGLGQDAKVDLFLFPLAPPRLGAIPRVRWAGEWSETLGVQV